jgi:anti-sigma28 factor (negative regulator of flagellin synthesis)
MKRTVHSLSVINSPNPAEAHALARDKATVRGERVQHLKERIQQGIYEVSAKDVARGIARSKLLWTFKLDYPRSYPAPQLPPK